MLTTQCFISKRILEHILKRKKKQYLERKIVKYYIDTFWVVSYQTNSSIGNNSWNVVINFEWQMDQIKIQIVQLQIF